MRILKTEILFIIIFIFLFNHDLISQSIVNSKHNLSVSGPGTIKASSETEICIFCHTPHNSSPQKPLWNRQDPALNYTLYTSSTTNATLGQPDGSSILCLSCHDGTIALGNVLSRTTPIEFTGGITTMPSGTSNLTKDVSNDHPVSFVYNSTLATLDGELVNPSGLTGPVQLENQKMQCISCHDPHSQLLTDFLVTTNEYSGLCNYCHQRNYWNSTSHKLSNATWNGTGTDPWFHTDYTTVSRNACENCHNPHSADGKKLLMNFLPEENNCYTCHNGNVASKNIQTQFNKQYRHNVAGYLQVHDPIEPNVVQTRHVECQDCHNPHASKNQTANPPNVNGFLTGVKGVNGNGASVDPAQYQYEICYRCHADSPDKPPSASPRVININNVRLDFDLSNPSYHPIEGPGKNTTTITLIPPWTTTSVMYCTHCHASDGTTSPAGPHGSIYPQILKYNYNRDGQVWITGTEGYALCYQCHEINAVKTVHERMRTSHAKKSSCNTCHDPHGISGGTAINNPYLINFNTNTVSVGVLGVIKYEYISPGHGRCTLKCHSHDHDPATY